MSTTRNPSRPASRVTALPMRAARWSASHPWRAIGAWFGLVAVSVALAMLVPTQNATDEDYWLGESGQGTAWLVEAGLDDPAHEQVLITAPSGSLDVEEAQAAGGALADDMADLPGVAEVSQPITAPDGSAVLVDVTLDADLDTDAYDIGPLQDVTAEVAAAHPDLDIGQAGDLSLDVAIDERVGEDLMSAEVFTLPVTLALMLVVFGALIAAGLPVLLAATSVVATIGLSAPISHLIPAEPTVASMIVLIGMAVGVDYTLFYLKREREERARGRTTLDAVEIAAETSGHAIVVSAFAVVASLGGLYLLGLTTFNSLASGAIVVVAVAAIGSITVLPALLVKLGRWVDRPRVPLLWRLNARIGQGGISRRVLAPVVRRPGVALLVAGTFVGLLAAPALGLRLHTSTLDTLPADVPEVATLHALADAFPSQGTTAEVVVHGDAPPAEVERALADLESDALATGRFTPLGVESQEASADGRTHVLTLAMPYGETDPAVEDAVRDLREDLVPEALGGLDAQNAVTGSAADGVDYQDRQSDRMPYVIGAVLLLTMVMMAVSFRSLPIALVTTALNLLSVGVAFGVLRLVFQEGWFEEMLGFTSPGFVIDWIPLFVMVVLVGLSMDYHVFVLSRVRELVRRGLPARAAVSRGISDSAGVITSAAAVMVSVFAIFACLSMLEMKMMGVALSTAILLDATVIRLVLLPAILVLLGERVWRSERRDEPVGEVVAESEPLPLAAASRSM